LNIFLTCEHAGNEIPEKYEKYFSEAGEVLETHRGYDPGALDLFKELSRLAIFSQEYMISRLLIEPNRSLGHPQLFSEFTAQLPEAQKEELLEEYYLPYRNFVEGRIAALISEGKEIVHISVHTFTPQLEGEIRDADLGLLFDPARKPEEEFCQKFEEQIFRQNSNLKTRFNYPYLGVDDGFTTYLRKRFPDHYAGIELEVNQKYVQENKIEKRLKNDLFEALSKIL
jgi:predicted N-formylglutamate amidohydrolase